MILLSYLLFDYELKFSGSVILFNVKWEAKERTSYFMEGGHGPWTSATLDEPPCVASL